MSSLSPIKKNVAPLSDTDALPDLLFPLSTERIDPLDEISLERWLEYPIDTRAPIRSVAMVDVAKKRFVAVVIDTVEHKPLWWIVGPRDSFARLYDGMCGKPGTPSRGTMIVSNPRNPPSEPRRSMRPVGRTASSTSDAPAPESADDDCSPCPCALPTDTQGPKGICALCIKVADLVSLVGNATQVTTEGGSFAKVSASSKAR